jgi:hypothetical protein
MLYCKMMTLMTAIPLCLYYQSVQNQGQSEHNHQFISYYCATRFDSTHGFFLYEADDDPCIRMTHVAKSLK